MTCLKAETSVQVYKETSRLYKESVLRCIK